jgi:hypothetical protein
MWKRRLALEIASQLPERREDAIAVLKMAQEVLDRFLIVPGCRNHLHLIETERGEEGGG